MKTLLKITSTIARSARLAGVLLLLFNLACEEGSPPLVRKTSALVTRPLGIYTFVLPPGISRAHAAVSALSTAYIDDRATIGSVSQPASVSSAAGANVGVDTNIHGRSTHIRSEEFRTYASRSGSCVWQRDSGRRDHDRQWRSDRRNVAESTQNFQYSN